MKTKTLRPLDTIESALEDLRLGKMIIAVDDEDRENEGDFIMAAEKITTEAINFMATVGRGLICTPVSPAIAQKLDLHMQVQTNTASLGTAFTVTIDAKEKISTGISSPDRAYSIKLMTEEKSTGADFARPGHIFPLIAKAGGVLERNGHTEAAVDLSLMAGFSAVGVICEIMNPDGSMARLPELLELATKHSLKVISIADLIEYRRSQENLISSVESIPFPTKYGDFQMYIFRSELLKEEHVVVLKGNPADFKDHSPLIRLHSECLTGDVFGSRRCDCGEQLEESMQKIEQSKMGAIIYLRQEGRGIGLFNKVKAYQLQDTGVDTADANIHLGFPVDARNYTMAHQILKYFGVSKFKLLTNNPTKLEAMKKFGHQDVERVSLEISAHAENSNYLMTKKSKLGHLLNQNFSKQ
jgi:3,4-dihydroxy 2-butanone 4-phosphate synthase / GTP cyclohydrolase II